MALERVTSHIKKPSLFILVAGIGKCKQINNSNLGHVSDIISLSIYERNYAISLMPCTITEYWVDEVNAEVRGGSRSSTAG